MSGSRCRPSGSARSGAIRVELASGDVVEAERLLVATGRRANVDGLGLEQLGVELTKTRHHRRRALAGSGRRVGDRRPERCCPPHARGEVPGAGRGREHRGLDYVADYRAIPAAVFTDPQVASVGTMDDDGLVTAEFRIEGGRLSTYERPKRPGVLKLAADPDERVLVGAVAVGPEAGEWIGQLTLAIRARISSTSCSTRSSRTRPSRRRSSARSRSSRGADALS